MSLHDDVEREALHDWLNERPPRERPDRCEYEPEEIIDALGRAALTPWPPERDTGREQ